MQKNKRFSLIGLSPIFRIFLFSLEIQKCGDEHWKMEVLKAMTAREVLNLIEWLKSKNFTSDDIVDCIEYVEGKQKKTTKKKKISPERAQLPPSPAGFVKLNV